MSTKDSKNKQPCTLQSVGYSCFDCVNQVCNVSDDGTNYVQCDKKGRDWTFKEDNSKICELFEKF